MNKTALITGASGGIGKELAKRFAKDHCNLVLIARDKEKLKAVQEELQNDSGIRISTIVEDLSDPSSPERLYTRMQKEKISVDFLVNNAGFGTHGYFIELSMQTERDQMQINMVTLTHLTRLFLPDMIKRKFGKILNVASTAAFEPGPLMTVYYATKAYVFSFSVALANEVKGTGVTVTVLSPGPTRTGFSKRADMENSKLFNRVTMDPATVAKAGYEGMMVGKVSVIPGFINKLGAVGTRLVSPETAARIARTLQEVT